MTRYFSQSTKSASLADFGRNPVYPTAQQPAGAPRGTLKAPHPRPWAEIKSIAAVGHKGFWIQSGRPKIHELTAVCAAATTLSGRWSWGSRSRGYVPGQNRMRHEGCVCAFEICLSRRPSDFVPNDQFC